MEWDTIDKKPYNLQITWFSKALQNLQEFVTRTEFVSKYQPKVII